MHERIPTDGGRTCLLHRKCGAKPTILLIEVCSSLLHLSETISLTHNAIVSLFGTASRYPRARGEVQRQDQIQAADQGAHSLQRRFQE